MVKQHLVVYPPSGQTNPWEQTLSELDAPKKNEIGIGAIIEYERKFLEDYQKLNPNQRMGWSSRDVKEFIKKDIDFEEPVIRGPVEVAKGNELVLALNSDQMEAVGRILDFYTHDVILKDYYVLLESTGKDPKKAEARLKFVSIRPSTQNHLVVSSAVAKELEVEQNKDIRILDVYQKVEDIDLDKI